MHNLDTGTPPFLSHYSTLGQVLLCQFPPPPRDPVPVVPSFPKLTTLLLQSEVPCTPPASPSCWNRSWERRSQEVAVLQIHLIPNRRRPVRNLLSYPPHNFKVYRHTSLYSSAETPAPTCPPSVTPTRSSPATSARAS